MKKTFTACVAMLMIAGQAGSAAAAVHDSPRQFLGQAAFGLLQVDVLLAALAALMILFVVSAVSRQYWLAEVGFLLVVAAGLVSNAFGMIALTMASLVSVLLLGLILDKLGFSAQLTPQDVRRIEGQLDATLREDLNVDPPAVRAAAADKKKTE